MVTQPSSIRPWVIWFLGALFFFSMYIPRVATGVITGDLMRDFAVSAGTIGTLTSFYFYPYLLAQIPVGLLVDRFGPRILLATMIILCGISSLFFAKAQTLAVAEVSRAMLGFGAAFAFVGALKLGAEWFPPSKIALLSGLTQSFGMVGAMVGQHPIAMAAESFGWRNTYLGIAAMFFLLAVFFFLIVRDRPAKQNDHDVKQEAASRNIWSEAHCVMANPQTWINGLYAGFLFAPTAAFAEQWGNYFLKISYGIKDGAIAITMIFAGWACAGPLLGWLSSRAQRRKPFMQGSALLSCLFFSLILYVPMNKEYLFATMFAFGVANTGLVLAYALATEINPHRTAGTSMAIANMMSILIGAAFQPLLGMLMDYFAKQNESSQAGQFIVHTTGDLQQALSTLPICLLIAFVLVFFIKETHCKPLEER